jgi:3-hydroxyacyl-[acyl-carrier-protein] dehydratase
VTNANITTTELLLQVPVNHPCFPDHFPGSPIVPGALMLKWLIALVEQNYSCQITHLKSVKFLVIVRPGNPLRISVNVNITTNQITLNCYVRETLVIKGQMGFAPIKSASIDIEPAHV